MRTSAILLMTGLVGIALACSDRSPTAPLMAGSAAASETAGAPAPKVVSRPRSAVVVPRGQVWGSDKASLTIKGSSATLEILALTLPTGACFGTYGEIGQPIPKGRFDLPGTYTQLMGVYPGRVQYAATYSGVLESNQITIAVSVPSLQQTIGPFTLAYGVNPTFTPCLYP